MRSLWGEYSALIFIMAAGIVVRVIAPLLKSKWSDPAVVVVDEKGKFAISLAGGHWGTANSLAREVADVLGALPVVTTATDVQERPAADVLAQELGFVPVPCERVKVVNSALLNRKRVVFYTEWELPASFSNVDGLEVVRLNEFSSVPDGVCVFVTSRKVEPFPERGLQLCPPSIAAGVGCKRGVSSDEIEAAVASAFELAGRRLESLSLLATHMIKADEAGLREAARKMRLPVAYLESQKLDKVMKSRPDLQDSQFVREKVGVGCVCVTAALAAVPGGEVVLHKTKLGRVTVALVEAASLWSVSGPAIRRICASEPLK